MDEINQKLDQFLPAIQQNLLDIMATEAVPGKFVMLPVKSSFIRKALSTFYTKYDIWFFCEDESGAHLVKHDHGDEKKKKGFEFFEVTAFGEAAMFVCKCLLMMAIKQLTGMSFFVAGAQVDLTQLRSSLTAVNTEILAYDVETLSKFKMDTASDWDAISRQVMPALKSFLSTKDKSMMGVKPSNDKAGRQKWLCDFHYKSTAVAGVINPPTYNSSNRQNDTAAAPVATATNVPGTSVNNTDLSNNTPDQYRMTKSEADFNQNAGPVQANNSYTPPSYVTHPRTPSAANTAGDKTASYVTGNNKDFNTATIPTFSHLSSIIVPETEAPKVNYHNPYLNADESDHSSVASGVDSKLAYVPFPGNSPQLERGATISAIDHRSPLGSPYSLSNASSPSNGHVLGRSSTIGGFDAHQYYGSHQKTDSSSTAPGQRKGSNASSSGGYGVQPPYQPNYPSTDYQNHQFQNTIYHLQQWVIHKTHLIPKITNTKLSSNHLLHMEILLRHTTIPVQAMHRRSNLFMVLRLH